MKEALFITSSANGEESVSGRLAAEFEAQLIEAHPEITYRSTGVSAASRSGGSAAER